MRRSAVALAGAQVLVTGNRSYVAETAAAIREHGNALRWIQFTTSGTDKAFANGLPPGIIVTNMAGLRAFSVAEQAFMLMLGLVRKIRATEAARRREDWVRDALIPVADNLAGKHLVIIGLGAIGQEIARMAKAFNMQVTGVSRAGKALPYVDRIRPRADLIAACAEADMVLVAALYEDGADKLLSRAAIAAMKPSAYVINVARGALVDEDALIDALAARRIAGAGLDVAATEPLPAGTQALVDGERTAHPAHRRCRFGRHRRKHRVRRHRQPSALDRGRETCEGRDRQHAVSVRRFGR